MNRRPDHLIAFVLGEHGFAEPLSQLFKLPALDFGHVEELHILVRQVRSVVCEKHQHTGSAHTALHLFAVGIGQTRLARLEQSRMSLMVEHEIRKKDEIKFARIPLVRRPPCPTKTTDHVPRCTLQQTISPVPEVAKTRPDS